MPIFSFTVGSLGDIVSLLQIAKTVTQALCDSKGPSEEYFDLITELDTVVHIVEGVQHELSIDGPNKLPASAENGLRHAVQRCLFLFQQMDKKISAWRRRFGIGWAFGKDVWLHLGWCLFTREELIGLRCRLSRQIEEMNTLLILAHGERLERFGRKQDEHTLEIRRKQDEHASESRQKQDEIASEIRRGDVDTADPDHGDWFPADQVHELMRSYVSSQPVPTWESWASVAPQQTPPTSRKRGRPPTVPAKLEVPAPLADRAGTWANWQPAPDIPYTPPPYFSTLPPSQGEDSGSSSQDDSVPSLKSAGLEVHSSFPAESAT